MKLKIILSLVLTLVNFLTKAETEPNNSKQQANNLPYNGNESGNLSGTDAEDWFVINVPKGGIYTLTVKKTGAGNGILELYDGQKTDNYVIKYIAMAGGDSPGQGWTLTQPLLTGKYYARFVKYSDPVNYQVGASLVLPPFTEDTEPNDSLSKAIMMPVSGSVTGNIHYYAAGRGTDNQDWYKIQLTQGGILKLTINKKGPGETWIRFRDGIKTGNPLISEHYTGFSESPAEGWNWSYPVLAGTYYFVIDGGAGMVDYKLDVSLIAPAYTEDKEPNDSVARALTMSVNVSITGNVHYYADGKALDPTDWYKIQLTRGGILKLTINKKGPGETWIRFRDGIKTGNPLISEYYTGFSESPADGWTWSYPVLAGTYYFVIDGGAGVVDYKLDAKLNPSVWGEDLEPNDSLKYAGNFAINDSVSGLIGYYKPGYGPDIWDWFVIKTTEFGYLSFQIEKKGTYSANVSLRDTIKEIASQNLGAGDFSVVFGKVVSKGKYYIGFQKYNGDLPYKARMKFILKPKADFTWVKTDNSFAFENKTARGESYQWNFGDDTQSFATNPFHEFMRPADFDVCMIAKNKAGNDTICQKVVVPGVDRIFPAQGGNTGDITLQVFGGGLDMSYVAKIKQGSTVIATSFATVPAEKGSIQVRFNLRTKPESTYDLLIEKQGGLSYLLPKSFKIVAGTKADPWVSISGRNRILFNTWSTYTVNYGNYGNVDAVMTPVWLVFSRNPGLEVELTGAEIMNTDSVSNEPVNEVLYSDQDIFFEQQKPVRIYPLHIPVIPAKSDKSFIIKVKTSENLNIFSWTGKPWFQSPMDSQIGFCIFYENAYSHKMPEEKLYCMKNTFDAIYNKWYNETIYNDWYIKHYCKGEACKNAKKTRILAFANAVRNAAEVCEVSLEDKEMMQSFFILLWMDYNIINPRHNSYPSSTSKKNAVIDTLCAKCQDIFEPHYLQTTSLKAVSSLDPNEKSGPTGFGPENYIPFTRVVPYNIYFENKASALAPAHIIKITDQLEKTKFDFSTFSFGNIYIGDTLVQVNPGIYEFAIDKKLDKLKVVARISGKLDTITGKLEWKLRSLDPVTLADIEDPDIGLLPPNTTSPRGEGSISFYVRLKNDPVNKASVTNQASIVFDANPAIYTNQHLATFDLAAPQSSVQSIAATTSARQFTVKWAGTDDGSGIDNYNIYVMKDNGPNTIWLAGTTESSAVYKSPADGNYQFSSVAIDKTGNVETLSDNPDATTNVVTAIDEPGVPYQEVKVYSSSSKDELTLKISIPGKFTFRIYGTDGRLRFEKIMNGNSIYCIKTSLLAHGLYLWQLVNNEVTVKESGKFAVGN